MKIHRLEITPDNTFYYDEDEIENKINNFIKIKDINEANILKLSVKDITGGGEDKKFITIYEKEI